MNVIRATFPTPIPRTNLIGATLEDKFEFSYTGSTITVTINSFDQVDAQTKVARHLVSRRVAVPLTPTQKNQIATIIQTALKTGGYVPSDATFAVVDAPIGG